MEKIRSSLIFAWITHLTARNDPSTIFVACEITFSLLECHGRTVVLGVGATVAGGWMLKWSSSYSCLGHNFIAYMFVCGQRFYPGLSIDRFYHYSFHIFRKQIMLRECGGGSSVGNSGKFSQHLQDSWDAFWCPIELHRLVNISMLHERGHSSHRGVSGVSEEREYIKPIEQRKEAIAVQDKVTGWWLQRFIICFN